MTDYYINFFLHGEQAGTRRADEWLIWGSVEFI